MSAGKPRRSPCRRCMVIRLHLMTAGPLLIIMAFFPNAAAGLAGKLPPPEAIAVLFPAVALPTFVVRFVRWHRAGRP